MRGFRLRQRERERVSIKQERQGVILFTVAELILDDHVIVLCPGGVVADQVRMGAQHSMSTHLTQSSRSERERGGEGVVGEMVCGMFSLIS